MNNAEKNAEIVRRGYAAFNSGDMDTLAEIFDERAAWHTPGHSSFAGSTADRNATFARFGRYVGETDGTFKANLKEVLRSENGRVVGIHHNVGKRNGKELDVFCCIEFELVDGRITSGREHFYDLYAWDEFWS